MDEGETLIEDLVILAASVQMGTDVSPINLIAEIQSRKADWPIITVSQLIDELEARSLGQIRPPQGDAGGREFLINSHGVSFARQITERRRPKSFVEKLGQWTRTDWIAFGAFVISCLSLLVSICALTKSDN